MLFESMLALSILGTSAHNGGLEIQVDQETKENVNKNLNEYDTPLFNKESETLNSEIQKKKYARQQTIKQSMFENYQRSTSQIADTKRTLFEEHKEPTTKASYIQQDQEKNILPYFLMSVGALFTIGFAILTISKWRKREKHDAT